MREKNLWANEKDHPKPKFEHFRRIEIIKKIPSRRAAEPSSYFLHFENSTCAMVSAKYEPDNGKMRCR